MLTKYKQRLILDKKLDGLKRNLVAVPPRGWIRTYRYLFDLSQNDLARLIGVSQRRIDYLEENEIDARIQISTLKRIAETLDCELYYAFIPKKPLEETRKSLINKSYQQKFGCEMKAAKAASHKIYRLGLRGLYGEDPTLF